MSDSYERMDEKTRRSYYLNYLQDAVHCFCAARMLQLNFRSLDPGDKMIDELLIRRLNKLATNLVDQAVNGLKTDVVSLHDQEQIMQKLLENATK